MKNKKIILGFLFSICIFALGMTNTFADTLGVVTTSRLNVRSGPSTKYRVVDKVVRNEKVTILQNSNGWYKVKLHDGKIGWSSTRYIKANQSQSNNNQNNNSSTGTTSKKMNVVATAYTGYGITSTGQRPVWGTIAVDPKVIPYGTKVYIPYFNKTFIANNCGGAIKGNKIDIYMNSKSECYNWGRRTIEIQILGK